MRIVIWAAMGAWGAVVLLAMSGIQIATGTWIWTGVTTIGAVIEDVVIRRRKQRIIKELVK